MKQRKVLLFDIETAPMTVYAWGRRDINIGLNQIKTDWFVLAWSAKWLGDPPSKIIYHDQSKAPVLENDKKLLQILWKLLDEAEVVITHNGRRFDSRKINARFILQGMNPPSPYQHIDTLGLVRSVADFTSNSLEYLTNKLCVKYKKLSHKKFPGQELWNACLAGNKAVWKEMRIYNIHDVLSLEEMYLRIRAWAPKSTPDVFVVVDSDSQCGTCGLSDLMRPRGYAYTTCYKIRRLRCEGCKRWAQGKKEKR